MISRHTFMRRAGACIGASALASAALIGIMAQPAAAADFTTTGALTPPDNVDSGVSRSVNVSGLQTVITDVDVKLLNVSHTNADDLDILLEGPDGTKVMLMSDARGTDQIVNANLKFNSSFSFLPVKTFTNAQIGSNVVTATYRPADFDDGSASALETVAPFTDGTTQTTLAAFNGKDPNGTWTVRVADDAATDTGSIAGGFTLTIQAAAPQVIPTCFGKTPTIVGTAGNDVLVGTEDDDVIVSLGGNDVVDAGKGNDVVCGGDGNDELKGKRGKDKLFGEAGTDTLRGGRDKDKCDGGPDNDVARKCERKVSIP